MIRNTGQRRELPLRDILFSPDAVHTVVTVDPVLIYGHNMAQESQLHILIFGSLSFACLLILIAFSLEKMLGGLPASGRRQVVQRRVDYEGEFRGRRRGERVAYRI